MFNEFRKEHWILLRLENGRILARDGEKAKRIYFIVSGKLTIVKRFKLRDGNLYNVMGYMGEGKTTDVNNFLSDIK
jgi:CRP-like cAMP-binding protein